MLVLHGLGGSSDGPGPRRLALALVAEGFAVLRLNLRGAGRGRPLARGTYCALCNDDLAPALARARQLAADLARAASPEAPPLPLFGAGISLGGTVLLNGCLHGSATGWPGLRQQPARSDRLRRPVRAPPQPRLPPLAAGPAAGADPGRSGRARGRPSVRPFWGRDESARSVAFDGAITAPRWGFASVAEYYSAASPLEPLLEGRLLPPTLLLHAGDDPWVPVGPLQRLAAATAGRGAPAPRVVITPRGGHNGFHAPGDGPGACWADRLVAAWLGHLSRRAGDG